MYRPTVRYADEYKNYIDQLFHSTTLDRNQLLRCALFSAAHSTEFKQIISHFKKKDVPTPLPHWNLNDWRWWRFQDVEKIDGGMDVNAYNYGKRNLEKDNSACGPGGKFDGKRNDPLQKEAIQRKTEGRYGQMAPQRGRDVIRGNGGGITIRINEKNKSG